MHPSGYASGREKNVFVVPANVSFEIFIRMPTLKRLGGDLEFRREAVRFDTVEESRFFP